jgi:hypothetical protein
MSFDRLEVRTLFCQSFGRSRKLRTPTRGRLNPSRCAHRVNIGDGLKEQQIIVSYCRVHQIVLNVIPWRLFASPRFLPAAAPCRHLHVPPARRHGGSTSAMVEALPRGVQRDRRGDRGRRRARHLSRRVPAREVPHH